MGPSRSAICLLVVEDEALIRLVLATELEQSGYEVLATDSAGAALDMVENSPDGFQALVTEIDLGDRYSGFDVARRCRQLRPDMPIVYIVGGQEPLIDAEFEPGSVTLGKPFQPDRLTGVLCDLLEPAGRGAGRNPTPAHL